LVLAYEMGMAQIAQFIEDKLARGRSYFSRSEALTALKMTPNAFTAAITRLIGKQRLANPRHGFYLILRPEDKIMGAPEPARWIDPLMKHQCVDYRISLLRAAAFHGSSHQAGMILQVVAPKQFRPITIGRQRIRFIYQASSIFEATNRQDWLVQLKTESGFAQTAGIELTLLDCIRYYRAATGIGGVAQIAKDLGGSANPKTLSKAAAYYENSSIRRLGYLLDLAGHTRQANALLPFVQQAKADIPLDPSDKHHIESLAGIHQKDHRWRLTINEPVEIDF
jgi:predicted transcriptional regulator of viral defense system